MSSVRQCRSLVLTTARVRSEFSAGSQKGSDLCHTWTFTLKLGWQLKVRKKKSMSGSLEQAMEGAIASASSAPDSEVRANVSNWRDVLLSKIISGLEAKNELSDR